MGEWNERVLLVASLVRRGEWTTYGDVAAAAGGSRLGARAVGRLAATNRRFANAHRVIYAGGRIPPGWGAQSGGPEECQARLQAEGVGFKLGIADLACLVGWRVLQSRTERWVSQVRA